MAEVEDAVAAPATAATTESEGATTDDDVHLSPTGVCRDGGGGRVKLLCSFGGRIMPRPPEGALKYIGGDTRVLAVPRSIPFREMKKKVEEMFKTEVAALKYQLLSLAEDLDVLVSVTCDEDLAHMLDEYDRLEAKRSPTASPRFRLYVFAPQAAPHPSAAPSRYAGFSRLHPQHRHHQQHQHHHYQPERYVATVPATPNGSPPFVHAHGAVSAGNSPRAHAFAPDPPIFEQLGGSGMHRVRSTPNLGSLDAAPQQQHLHPQAADAAGGLAGGYVSSSSPRHTGAGPILLHYQHQYLPAPLHAPHPAGVAGRYDARGYVRAGNYLAPMVPAGRPSDRPPTRAGPPPPHGEMQTPKKAALVWD